MKSCPACGEKDVLKFGKNKRRKDGLACYCRACSRRKAREYARTPAQQKKRRVYYEENREKLLGQAHERWRVSKHRYEAARQKWAADNRERMLGYYAAKAHAHQEFVDAIKDGKACFDCHRMFAPYVMEFDHVRGTKRWAIGKMANHRRERVLEEIEKCDLVCCVCHRIRSHARRTPSKSPRLQAFHEWLAPLKAGPCHDCGRRFPPPAMDFDHVSGIKVAGIAQMAFWGREKTLAEIAKCELVCANCHRERTVFRLWRAA